MTDLFCVIFLYNLTIKIFLTYQSIYALYRQIAQIFPYRRYFYVSDKIYHKYIIGAKIALKTPKKDIYTNSPIHEEESDALVG